MFVCEFRSHTFLAAEVVAAVVAVVVAAGLVSAGFVVSVVAGFLASVVAVVVVAVAVEEPVAFSSMSRFLPFLQVSPIKNLDSHPSTQHSFEIFPQTEPPFFLQRS